MEPAEVLVVEDDPVLQQLLWLNLSFAGHRVVSASDGVGALKVIAKQRPQIIVLDMMMPRCDGETVLRELRADAINDGTHVVVVSARATDEEIWQGWQLGADHYLTKPVKIAALVDLVNELVSTTRTRSTLTNAPS